MIPNKLDINQTAVAVDVAVDDLVCGPQQQITTAVWTMGGPQRVSV